MTAYIGYTNLVKSGAVTVTSEATGFEKENAQSWKTSTWWQAAATGTVYFNIDMGAAVDVDCWGLVGHNLSDNSGTIKPEYSATGAYAGEEADFDTIETPTANTTIFKKTTSVNARYFRFEIASTGAASFIANLFLGEALQLERGQPTGFAPANLDREREIYNNTSQGGNFLGRAVQYKGSSIDIQQKKITRTWIDANWSALADHVELYPFYFIWDSENQPDEAAYCIAKKITYPKYSDTLNFDFSLDCEAIYDV